ncbi:MAG: hypothetical protein HY687_05275 [Chloroflexi bacterium]|nr:hypothetical protein [Chloroflexota bacterium]
MEKLIDEVWSLALQRISKKEPPTARPSLGDDIDLYVPQTRALLLMEANPAVASLIYHASYEAANRNAYVILRKLGMPADYFWKFEYWPQERAFEALGKVLNRVFAAMLGQSKEGRLELVEVNAERLRFTVAFADCAECAGVTAGRGLCCFHAAMFAGIIAAAMNKDMDGFETACSAQGDATCTFLIGKRDEPEIGVGVSDYLAPKALELIMADRLNRCLQGHPLRSLGNLVNIGYYQALVTNCVITNPKLFSMSSFNVGVECGAKTAAVITEFYQEHQVEVIKRYYGQLRHLDVRAIAVGDNVDIVLGECAEVAATLKSKELLGFLFGELQGLVSHLINRRMVYTESWFEDTALRVRLSPQV